MTAFALPESATGLRVVDESVLDLRPDSAIIDQLRTFRPVTTEKNVWAYWDKGIDAMYPSYRCTVVNWVRRLGPSWTVRLVDIVEGSPNNIYNFVSKDWFPACFLNKTMDGKHAAQHGADLVRLPLLYEHGGVWMDVSNMLHTHLDKLFWDDLANPDSPYEMAAWVMTGWIRKKWGSFGNFMLAARRHCLFIKNWHLGYKALWAGRTNAAGFHTLPLIQEIGLADGLAEDDDPSEVLRMSDYVAQMLIGDRTRNLLDVETGWSGRDFFRTKVLLTEGIRNGYTYAFLTDFDGPRQVDLLTTRLDDPDPERRRAAEAFVLEVLAASHMCKVYHNSGAASERALGDLIKTEALRDADHRPGTYGEMYRYGAVHWEATRPVERLEPQFEEEELIRATPSKPAQEAQ